MRLVSPSLTVLILACTLAGCGVNLLKSTEKKDAAEDATLALERRDETTAIHILNSALHKDPVDNRDGTITYTADDDPELLSILSTAYAQRADIDLLEFADQAQTNATAIGSNLTSLYAIMPVADADHLSDINYSVDCVLTIPTDQHLPGDEFKMGIYQLAKMVLSTKALDKNGDGVLEPDELLDMSDASATSLLANLSAVAQVLAGTGQTDATAKAAAEAIQQYQSQIDATPGATPEEKLRNYLAQNPEAGGSVAP